MSESMSAYTSGFQHSGMPAKDLDETIEFYTKTLGFELAGLFHNGDNRCAFLRYGGLTIETWEGDAAPLVTGAINHWALDAPDIEAAWKHAHELGLRVKESEIQTIPGFWDRGIRFFNVLGPNEETIEFCQIL
ncbi:VOC family protein [Bifidobacterium tsurumiense]|uniref:Glyoxalase family protein n=1 Tax=Bifidobacterium tsurumiense TaxID=356829 RepID=A0A087ECB7_9BIFI|nr:VOC family protein [Bifidobacterium tsurumiense]KFJ05418.1 glyoxalase family protein [Bifidobacterium tsurumiense]MDY4677851.1 VOC family protein [Bifidobacterium tsurumiense]MSS12346.1 VOC family protein [Bifidobacterium tsurumiense]